ncbi:unnamed protein product, partial [Prunus brigantina]
LCALRIRSDYFRDINDDAGLYRVLGITSSWSVLSRSVIRANKHAINQIGSCPRALVVSTFSLPAVFGSLKLKALGGGSGENRKLSASRPAMSSHELITSEEDECVWVVVCVAGG